MEITACFECPFKDWPGEDWIYCKADQMSASKSDMMGLIVGERGLISDSYRLRVPFPGTERPEECPLPITINQSSHDTAR